MRWLFCVVWLLRAVCSASFVVLLVVCCVYGLCCACVVLCVVICCLLFGIICCSRFVANCHNKCVLRRVRLSVFGVCVSLFVLRLCLFVVCCSSGVVRCVLFAVRCWLSVVWCMLFIVLRCVCAVRRVCMCCALFGVCCLLIVDCCVLSIVSYVLRVVRCMWRVACLAFVGCSGLPIVVWRAVWFFAVCWLFVGVLCVAGCALCSCLVCCL